MRLLWGRNDEFTSTFYKKLCVGNQQVTSLASGRRKKPGG